MEFWLLAYANYLAFCALLGVVVTPAAVLFAVLFCIDQSMSAMTRKVA
jgi:hypothetical protein